MKRKEFIEILEQKFGGYVHIVTLNDLTKNISAISKVRVGSDNSRTNTNYAEISLKNVDNLGYINIPDDYKGHAPANPTSLDKQALNYHDLIIPFRNSLQSMGLIKKRYDDYPLVVGNNSMIRVEFEFNKQKDTPVYVMNYLKLPLVAEYIDNIRIGENPGSSKSTDRSPLAVEVLENLPIPMFYESDGAYRDYIHSRLNLVDTFISIQKKVDFLKEQFKDLEINKNDLPPSKSITFSSQAEKTYLLSDIVKEFEKKLEGMIHS
jgi:hypothetical protein